MSDNESVGWLLVGGLLLDGTMAPALANGAVLIKNGRIVAAGERVEVEAQSDGNTRVIDASGYTIMPGLFDCHQHLDHIGTPRVSTIERALTISLEYNCVAAVPNARTVLEAGITTVRDIGCRGNLAVAVRDAVNAGIIPGPRIIASGNIISTTAGLADFYPAWIDNPTSLGTVVNGTDEIRRAVRKQIRAGVDNIKLEASGSVPPFTGPRQPSMTLEEIKVACEEGRRRGKIVAAHAEHIDAVKTAIRGGVNTIEHGEYLDDEAVDLFLEHNAYLDATTCNLNRLRQRIEDGANKGLPQGQIDKMKKRHDAWVVGFQRAHEAGVKIIAGSDSVPHGKNATELETLVRYGLTPAEAIHAGTAVSAEAMRVSDDVGTLTPGKYGDLLLVRGNPLENIELLKDAQNIVVVMKAGKVVVDRASVIPNNAA